jgi:serine protease Do
MRRFTLLTVVLTSVVAFLVGIIVAGGLTPSPVVSTAPSRPPSGSQASRSVRTAAMTGVVNFADVAERINAAVVNIDATSKTSRDLRPRRDEVDAPGRDYEGPRQGSGSGFFIDREGFILTNQHVIEGAERITVTLADGRSFRAQVVGADPAIDVALLRVKADGNLPEAPLGNSDDLRVGEWVCAIGNPLGYVHSVTVGVVSFIGRKLFDASLDDYIQTDAAINFGNSGGPLINSAGQVVGINSAISSRASNIGFAVPINQAVAILPQLKAQGRVARGFIGVGLTDITPALQRALNLPVSKGAMVQDVSAGSPAERAGLRPYDIVLDVEGRQVLNNEELIRDISARQPGSIARLEVMREGRRQSMPVKLAERPARDRAGDRLEGLGPRSPRPREIPAATDVPLGLSVRELDQSFIGRLEIPEGVNGVVISRVDPTGAGFQAMLRRGFIIMEINKRPVARLADYQRLVAAARPGEILAVYVYDPTLQQRSLVTVTVE